MEERLNICNKCGYEGPENETCPDCGGEMIPAEEAKEIEAEGEEVTGEEQA